jgi:hypothetical protein
LRKNEIDALVLPSSLNIEKLDLLQNKLFLVAKGKTDSKRLENSKDIFKRNTNL